MGYANKLTPSEPDQPAKLSRPGADPISLRRGDLHAIGRNSHSLRVSGADQLALARIAERFAPGAQQAPAPDLPEAPKVHPFELEVPQSPAAVSLATLAPMRTLIAVLIGVALLPTLVFGAMLWLGPIKTPWSMSGGTESNVLPAARSALAATRPAPDQARSKQAAAIGALALTTPDTLEAKAGQDVPFIIALDQPETCPLAAPLPSPDCQRAPHCPRGVPMTRRNGIEARRNRRPAIGSAQGRQRRDHAQSQARRARWRNRRRHRNLLKVASDPEASHVAP